MKTIRLILAILLSLALLLCTGCNSASGKPEETTQSTAGAAPETTEPAQASETESLAALRQETEEAGCLFAVAYFGYHETIDSDLPVDPYEAMREYTCWLCEDLPFLTQIPAERVIGTGGELYCIVPLDENAVVAISKGTWHEEIETYRYEQPLYFSQGGEPILLLCNNSGWEPDIQVSISGPSGEAVWYPQIDDNHCVMQFSEKDLIYDFSSYRELLIKRYRDTEGEWIMPTADILMGTTWRWEGFLKDGREVSYRLSFHGDTLSVIWNDGIDAEDHEYRDAPWELTYEEEFAVLSIDFGAMAGVLRYNLLYHEEFDLLYAAIDAVQEEMPIGWEPQYRFLASPAAPEPVEMLGEWELVWTEVEDDRNEAEPGSCSMEIRMSASSGFLASYTSREYPHNNFENELLVFDTRQMYYGCGNDAWVADLDYVGPWDTTYAVTLTEEDVLIKQNYFLVDGAPMVSYEYFYRIGEGLEYDQGESNEEDPYAYAEGQGWQAPELSQLMDTFWLSWGGYALELADDSVPGDNGGWAKIYDVNENGAYTESYSGSWSYEAGVLHLSLVPLGNGYLVDDGFPVLMLGGELRIGRTENGIGLPHFYADMLMDTLQQPKG